MFEINSRISHVNDDEFWAMIWIVQGRASFRIAELIGIDDETHVSPTMMYGYWWPNARLIIMIYESWNQAACHSDFCWMRTCVRILPPAPPYQPLHQWHLIRITQMNTKIMYSNRIRLMMIANVVIRSTIIVRILLSFISRMKRPNGI